ncbi:hypothetical protein [Paenibacillus alba]|uniref:Uncharacterized protein n=1 Tax=Paenibacillus alba TaxID=1197127 RepID=A0ABU6G4U7_9BACL|nr:hypothetical protein [Paenibacillus alba]MEC0229203.1 hypothetical protein [Paenibacillus alba]
MPGGIIPAIVHPFCLENGQNGEKPAIMHPLECFSRFKEEKTEKACTLAGFLSFHAI